MEKIKRFLIVSENKDHAMFFKGLLWEKQIQDVAMCDKPKEAISLIEAKRIQFVIVEREMKDLSGSLLIQKIKSQRTHTYIPCLLFSAQLSDETVRLAKELGKDILRVPLIKEQVWPVIQSICEREEAVDQLELEMRKAEGAIVEKQYPQALEIIKGATKNTPPNARSFALGGEAHFQLGDLQKAEKFLENALTDRQNYTPAMQLLAKVYSRTGRHPKAINLLSAMVEASPENLMTLLGLGAAYSEANQLQKAKEILYRVRSMDPGNSEAAAELGKIAFREGEVAKAEEYLAEAEEASELGRFFNNLAIGMVNQKNLDDAVRTYEAALRILKDKEPQNLIFLQYNLGIAVKKKGNMPLAFALLSACCMADPSYDRAYFSLLGVVKQMRQYSMPFDEELMRKIRSSRQGAA